MSGDSGNLGIEFAKLAAKLASAAAEACGGGLRGRRIWVDVSPGGDLELYISAPMASRVAARGEANIRAFIDGYAAGCAGLPTVLPK